MVVEQREGEDPPTATGGVPIQQSQPRFPIAVVEDNIPPVDAAIGHVEQAVLDGETFGDLHGNRIPDPGSDVQNSKLAELPLAHL